MVIPSRRHGRLQGLIGRHASLQPRTPTIHCGQCGSRLIVSDSKNLPGKVYCDFICAERHSKRTTCTQQTILIEDYYTRVRIAPVQQESLSRMLRHEFDRLMQAHLRRHRPTTRP